MNNDTVYSVYLHAAAGEEMDTTKMSDDGLVAFILGRRDLINDRTVKNKTEVCKAARGLLYPKTPIKSDRD